MFCWSGILSSCLSLWFRFVCVHVIYGLDILSCLIRYVFVNMSFICPIPLTICCLRYCSVIIDIFWMCLVLHVITLPVFATPTLYDHPLWSVLLLLTINPCVCGPPSSLYMTAVDPIGKILNLCEYHCSLNIFPATI